MILGVDTGGTFTDFALFSAGTLRTHKVLSTPDAPERAILQGIQEMGLAPNVADGEIRIIHGSTVATNAALEGKGVKTAFITTKGFKDTLSIGRQTRPQLYHLESPPQAQAVAPELCLELVERIDAHGNIIKTLEQESLQELVLQLEKLKPQAIAINLLFSFLNSHHEELVEKYLHQHLSWKPFICRSSIVLPEYKEYERGIATWLNASLGPLIKDYILRLKTQTHPSPLAIMQSSGGTISAEQASEKAVNLLLSGPAGGLAAASFLAKSLGEPQLITFDMGGTSTDVALISDGKINLTNEGQIGPYPVSVPMVDMHTIGAGGGSIAYVDEGHLLKVGPQSAGANPGPACYGLNGKKATVTDANLVLGRLLPQAFLGGALSLDSSASCSVIKAIGGKLALTPEEAAAGIISIANEHMARALRVISVERGHNPKDFRLCCFGGAGGLHICALADALEMKKALVPIHAGVLSAIGMFLAPVERHVSKSYQGLLNTFKDDDINTVITALLAEAIDQIHSELGQSDAQLSTDISVDLRYQGQSSYLNLPWDNLEITAQAFHSLHEARYGHQLSTELELVNIRVAAKVQSKEHQISPLSNTGKVELPGETKLFGYAGMTPVYQRRLLCAGQRIQGPALVTATNATTLIDSNWEAKVDKLGNLFLNKA